MRRALALGAEVLHGLHEPGAEVQLPVAVHRHAGGERVRGVDEPAGESEPVGRGVVGHGRERRRNARAHFVEGLVVVAAVEHVREPALGALLHDERRRQRADEVGLALAGGLHLVVDRGERGGVVSPVVPAHLKGLLGAHGGGVVREHGEHVEELTVGALPRVPEVETVAARLVDDFHQEVIDAGVELDRDVLLVGRDRAAGVVLQRQPAVHPHLDRVVAAERQVHRSAGSARRSCGRGTWPPGRPRACARSRRRSRAARSRRAISSW